MTFRYLCSLHARPPPVFVIAKRLGTAPVPPPAARSSCHVTRGRDPAPGAAKRNSHVFALRPAPGAIAEMRQLRDAPGLAGTATPDKALVVTLFWFGYDSPNTAALIAAARAAAGATMTAPFRLLFDQLISTDVSLLLTPSEPLPHLHAFQHRLATALAHRGVRPGDRWRFSPHVTLRRGAGPGFSRAIDPIAWTVTDLLLLHSRDAHARYRTLGAWPLRG